ncbi:MAG: DUF928 domain-containing protein [Oscillatoria sp. Prado101]|jgi:hypothetical protein|nr:DUF928 domain-containing protein [Oscillatoria sp. Prado101]
MKYCLQLLPLSLALSLGLAATASLPISVRAQSQETALSQSIAGNWNAFNPPNRGLPGEGRQEGGGVRGGNCPNIQNKLIPLVPATNMGLTISERPTLYWYVPETAGADTAAPEMEFVLQDEDGKEVYNSGKLPAVERAGIVSYTMPAKAGKSLEVGKNYQWFFSIICNPEDRSGDVRVQGWIKRVEKSNILAQKLEAVSENERPFIYAKESLWFDTLSSLAQLQMQNSGDEFLSNKWEELLNSVSLGNLAKAPFVNLKQSSGSTSSNL